MRFEILLSPEAIEDLKSLKANDRARVRDSMERHLRDQPRKESRSRIKRMKGVTRPQYRLRVDDIRVFYDVDVVEEEVWILAVVRKEGATEWLESIQKKR